MKAFILIFLCAMLRFTGTMSQEAENYRLVQNKPAELGAAVTFTIISENGAAEPTVAWDFGDDNGPGVPKKGWSVSHTFIKPGVYYVFARIQGEEFPPSMVQMIIKPMQKPAPTHSTTICLDNLNKKLWVVNPDNHSVSLIDASTYKLIREIPTGKHPRTVTLDKQNNAWVANEDDATISVISAEGQAIKTIKLPYASRPYGICSDPLKQNMYVTLQGTGHLLKISITSNVVLKSLDVGRSPRGIAVSSDGKKVFVTQFISPEDRGVVREIAAETMVISNAIELAFDQADDFEDRGRGVPNFLSSITISPDGTEAWIPSKKDNTARGLFRDGQSLTFDNTVRTIVSKINLTSGKENLPARLDINDADMACAVEFSPYGNIAFIALQGNNKVVMVDVEFHSKLGTLDTTGLAPQGMVLNEDGTRLFVHNFMSRSVRVINTGDIVMGNNQVGTTLATIPTVINEALSDQVLKGKQIFYNAQDERMTFAGYISCASCHVDGGSDERVWDFTDRGEGFRNTHTLNGRTGTGMGNVHWTSNFDEIQDFENDMRNGFGGKGFLSDEAFNRGTVSDPLGDKKAGLSPELDALAAYVNSLDKVHPSPYRNQNGTLTADAVEGKKIFAQAGCATCHSGTDFTDRKTGAFHDVGTIQTSSGKRRNGILPGFGTPTLKGIWETAPYLHDGSAATLRDVLVARNMNKKHGDLSAYSETEMEQLIAYLLQIDESEAIPTGLSDSFFAKPGFLEVKPNPSTDLVRLQWKEPKPYGKITIYQMNGLSLYTAQVNSLNEVTVDVSNFTPGMYLVDYFDGVNRSTAKMIVRNH